MGVHWQRATPRRAGSNRPSSAIVPAFPFAMPRSTPHRVLRVAACRHKSAPAGRSTSQQRLPIAPSARRRLLKRGLGDRQVSDQAAGDTKHVDVRAIPAGVGGRRGRTFLKQRVRRLTVAHLQCDIYRHRRMRSPSTPTSILDRPAALPYACPASCANQLMCDERYHSSFSRLIYPLGGGSPATFASFTGATPRSPLAS
jgi:hypothetical protein